MISFSFYRWPMEPAEPSSLLRWQNASACVSLASKEISRQAAQRHKHNTNASVSMSIIGLREPRASLSCSPSRENHHLGGPGCHQPTARMPSRRTLLVLLLRSTTCHAFFEASRESAGGVIEVDAESWATTVVASDKPAFVMWYSPTRGTASDAVPSYRLRAVARAPPS